MWSMKDDEDEEGDGGGVQLWESTTSITPPLPPRLPSLGRVLSTLLSLYPRQLHTILSHDHLHLQKSKNQAARAAASLFHHVMDAVRRESSLAYICVPLLEHVVRSKDSKNRKQVTSLFEWLFRQHEKVCLALARSLSHTIGESQCEKHVKLGWCIVVRVLLQITYDKEKSSRQGPFSHEALLIIANSISQLVHIVLNESIQEGKERIPTRLTTAAADCILMITWVLSEPGYSLKIGHHEEDNLHSKRLLEEPAFEATGAKVVMMDPETSHSDRPQEFSAHKRKVLWNGLDNLMVLVSELHKWNYINRPLHAKGLQQVMKHLQVLLSFREALQVHEGTDSSVGEEVLKICWTQYSGLMIIEDHFGWSSYEALLPQYVDALQNSVNQGEQLEVQGPQPSKNSKKEEIRGYGLACLALLLGRFDTRRLEAVLVKFEPQLLQILLQQLCSKESDIVDLTVVILKATLFRSTSCQPNGAAIPVISRMETIAPMLLDLLDKKDSTSRAVVSLIAEYLSVNPESPYVEKLFSFLDSEDADQRKNALDVLSELFAINPEIVGVSGSVLCQKIAKLLLARLGDEELTNRIQASTLFSKLEPTYILPALLQTMFSLDARVRSSSSSAILALLKGCLDQCHVISVLLDCLRSLGNVIHVPGHPGQIGKNSMLYGRKESKGGLLVDMDRVMHLIPEWASSVEEWDSLINFVLKKMFAEPSNPVIPKFLSKISGYLADNSAVVYDIVFRVLKEQPSFLEDYTGEKDKGDISETLDGKFGKDLFHRLSPLLVLKVLPMRAYDDLHCQILYSPLGMDCDTASREPSTIASMLISRMCSVLEFEDVRKLSAELVGRLLPQVMLPQVVTQLQDAVRSVDTLRAKACIFALCNSLMLREEIVKDPLLKVVQKLLFSILLWTNETSTQDVEKTQHGCIDCLAIMIRAELVLASGMDSSLAKKKALKSASLIEEIDSNVSEDIQCQPYSNMGTLCMVRDSLLGCHDGIISPEHFPSSFSPADLSCSSQDFSAKQKLEAGNLLFDEKDFNTVTSISCRRLEQLGDTHTETDTELTEETQVHVGMKQLGTTVPISLRVCMANVLISTCSKIPQSLQALFSMTISRPVMKYVQEGKDAYLRAACLQVLFSSVYHLKSAIIVSSSPDLIRLSLTTLRRNEIPEERINAAKLLASLLASEEILEEIKPYLMDVQLSLMSISHLDSSPELRSICEKLLGCMSTFV